MTAHETQAHPTDVVTDDAAPLPPDVLPAFAARHIGPGPDDVATMLDVLGYGSLEELVDAAIPRAIRTDRALALEAAPSEAAVTAELRELASRNTVLTSLIGLGYYGTHTPPVIRRNVLE
ncbi:MAG TPA: glycine dehydrogenase (aminomethyl-transferring), partial [Ornithinicoccus sp.]|nr:glycine dehydrogenase (aminomethyl-transferring) [Ornithinicoccus sp.]